MTMVHHGDHGHCTTPLAYSPVFYIDLCAKTAAAAGMEDALLAAVITARKIFNGISAQTDSRSAEAMTIDVLFHIATASYARGTIASCFQSVETMLFAALHDIKMRGYRDHGTVLSTVLPNIAALMPFEVAMDKAGKRAMQTFPPYSIGFEANLAALLFEVANQARPAEGNRPRYDPFHEFQGASEAVASHFREVTEHVAFEGCLLQKWVADNIFRCVEVHLRLIDNPPKGTEQFIATVYKSIRPFIYVHAPLFKDRTGFDFYRASDACGNLAVLGMALLRRQHLKLAEECGATIASIAGSAAASSLNRYKEYGWADCMVALEILALAAGALGHAALATAYRARCSRPEYIAEPLWTEYEAALQNRIRQRKRELGERRRDYELELNPISVLRELLTRATGQLPETIDDSLMDSGDE
jgi:hypothetical protein